MKAVMLTLISLVLTRSSIVPLYPSYSSISAFTSPVFAASMNLPRTWTSSVCSSSLSAFSTASSSSWSLAMISGSFSAPGGSFHSSSASSSSSSSSEGYPPTSSSSSSSSSPAPTSSSSSNNPSSSAPAGMPSAQSHRHPPPPSHPSYHPQTLELPLSASGVETGISGGRRAGGVCGVAVLREWRGQGLGGGAM
eukprot:CAMPEP_0114139630 /NCGR_PEP_ID=MMETSP0043_2-20121206/16957_1 /TAXON_ID=464988 /ORGANISM="Hemiselmis andersenii, Strain CCMP644" /LENGTH=193 /DNA_ID=CAMNT_0001233677 /DNA_START=592 /DNA_END=1170 /DNA_ORIENTATION=+